MGIAGRQALDRLLDRLMGVADHAGLAHLDAVIGQRAGQIVGVGIPGAPLKDLVADDQHRGCGGLHARLAFLFGSRYRPL